MRAAQHEENAASPTLDQEIERSPEAETGTERVKRPSVLTAAPRAPAPGTVLGSYRIIEVIGEGGMGTVYSAEHLRLRRKVALKVLHPNCATNPVNVSRFFGEACAVNQISHENIIEITDFFDGDGAYKYYIMELLEGHNLHQLLKSEGVPYFDRSLDIVIQVAEALGEVHEAGIVHRDLKPANIFLIERAGQTDFVKLLDFGIAKLIDVPTGESLHKTAAGTLLGTPDYMSPEQSAGRDVDNLTDMYSLGVILYELATGRRPFSASSCAELLVKHMTAAPVPPSEVRNRPFDVPLALEALILECLQKRPEHRPQSMKEVATRLRDIRGRLPADRSGSYRIPPVDDASTDGEDSLAIAARDELAGLYGVSVDAPPRRNLMVAGVLGLIAALAVIVPLLLERIDSADQIVVNAMPVAEAPPRLAEPIVAPVSTTPPPDVAEADVPAMNAEPVVEPQRAPAPSVARTVAKTRHRTTATKRVKARPRPAPRAEPPVTTAVPVAEPPVPASAPPPAPSSAPPPAPPPKGVGTPGAVPSTDVLMDPFSDG